MNQYGTLGKLLPVIPLRVNDLLQKYRKYVWYQDDISLEKNRLVRPLKFGAAGRNKLKHPDTIKDTQWE